MKITSGILIFVLSISITMCKPSVKENTGPGHPEWKYLFDGQTLNGWRLFQSDSTGGWFVEDSCLVAGGTGSDLTGDLISIARFSDFELELEWKIAPGGNSGIMYHVQEGEHKTTYETGPEYQLIDDTGFGSPLEDWQKTGANYAMHNPHGVILKPVGEFNSTRLVVNGPRVEHWLNGVKILEFERWTPEWNELVKQGKWKDYPSYGLAKEGHLALQDHGSKIWFRNIRIKTMSHVQ